MLGPARSRGCKYSIRLEQAIPSAIDPLSDGSQNGLTPSRRCSGSRERTPKAALSPRPSQPKISSGVRVTDFVHAATIEELERTALV